MRKGVANTWRYFQVGTGANRRYLDALAAATPYGEGIAALDALCRPRTNHGRHVARFPAPQPSRSRPVPGRPRRRAHHRRFRNHHLAARLYTDRPTASKKPTAAANAFPVSSSSCAATASSPKSREPGSTASPPTATVCSTPPSPSTTTASQRPISQQRHRSLGTDRRNASRQPSTARHAAAPTFRRPVGCSTEHLPRPLCIDEDRRVITILDIRGRPTVP